MPEWSFPIDSMCAALPDGSATMRFHYALRHGSMKLGLYAPVGEDVQYPHRQDELYIVISGTGRFVKNGEGREFEPGDALFVEAGAEHRFISFTADFATWVIFWGPDGGEGAATRE